jgi:hypothetical protein
VPEELSWIWKPRLEGSLNASVRLGRAGWNCDAVGMTMKLKLKMERVLTNFVFLLIIPVSGPLVDEVLK